MKNLTYLLFSFLLFLSSSCGCRMGDGDIELEYIVNNGHAEDISIILTTDVVDSFGIEILSLGSFTIGSSFLATSCDENAQDRLDDAQSAFDEMIIIDASGDTCSLDATNINNWDKVLISDETGTISLNLREVDFQ